MIDNGLHCVGCPLVSEAFVVNEAAEMAHNYRIGVFCAVRLMAADQRDVMIGANPGIVRRL
jgi:hypothetical protein